MERLFLGISEYVVSINKLDGSENWRTKLKFSSIVNVYYADEKVFAHAGGHLFCVDATDGKILWENTLSGLGYGTCIIASDQQNTIIAASQKSGSAAAASAAQ